VFVSRLWLTGFNIQPEAYYSVKTSNRHAAKSKLSKALDVPLLFGGKFGALGFGVSLCWPCLLLFIIDKGHGLACYWELLRCNLNQNFAGTVVYCIDVNGCPSIFVMTRFTGSFLCHPSTNMSRQLMKFSLFRGAFLWLTFVIYPL